ncbi:hypothetical protein [Rhodococcoides kyotonense]|uniref:hypothetical protein n=1 Tax=Rhodococcoides kyotonense TaxID=398843 RepID=UPI001130FED8|nr:hypothetical protein [Rhodococcus kyotonensis]
MLPYEDWIARDCIGAAPAEGGLLHPLHPAWTLIGALRGMGLTLSQLFAVMGVGDDDGVMFGEADIEHYESLRAEREYSVTGRFLDVRRKTGSTLGAFDLISFELSIDYRNEPAVKCVNTFVVPRKDAP